MQKETRVWKRESWKLATRGSLHQNSRCVGRTLLPPAPTPELLFASEQTQLTTCDMLTGSNSQEKDGNFSTLCFIAAFSQNHHPPGNSEETPPNSNSVWIKQITRLCEWFFFFFGDVMWSVNHMQLCASYIQFACNWADNLQVIPSSLIFVGWDWCYPRGFELLDYQKPLVVLPVWTTLEEV